MIESNREIDRKIGSAPSLANPNHRSWRSMNRPNYQERAIRPRVNWTERQKRSYATVPTQMPLQSVPPAQRFQIMVYFAGILTATCVAIAAT
jgi:hypothetical protein